MAPRPVSAEHARQRKCLKAKAYRERVRQQKQHQNRQADAQAESAELINERSQVIEESSLEIPSSPYEESNRLVTEPTVIAHTSDLPDSPEPRLGEERTESTNECLGAPVNSTSAPKPTCQYTSEIQDGPEQRSSQEQDPSLTDPTLIRREQTRLRVQRYRARQHQLRLGATADTADNTVSPDSYYGQDDGILVVQNLTLDEVAQPVVPTEGALTTAAASVRGENAGCHPDGQADYLWRPPIRHPVVASAPTGGALTSKRGP